MCRNLIVMSDGTNQKGGEGFNTNVYKLFNMLENRTERQIVFYDPGLGTGTERIFGSAFGRGFSKNMLECYKFIFDNFQADDKIFLFGFSRGAATVRSLSGFIHLFGVLPKSRWDILEDAFDIYKIKDYKKREDEAEAFIRRHHTMWADIEFLGVWDTVASLGIPNSILSGIADHFFPYRFHNFNLSKSVKTACQALALDENRKNFLPVLWNKLDEDATQKMKQVWFCGVHSDVGGGYGETDLSDITLKWMIRQAQQCGLRIFNDPKTQLYQKLLDSTPNVNGRMHNERLNSPWKWFPKAMRSWCVKDNGSARLHTSVKQRLKNIKNEDDPAYACWLLLNALKDEEVEWDD